MVLPYPLKIELTMKTYYQTLHQKDRRRYAAVEAAKLGRRRHRLHCGLAGLRSKDRSARPGRSQTTSTASRMGPKKRGGRKRLIDTQPQLQANFHKILEDHTAGDPVKPEALWTNLWVSAITDSMAELGTPVDRSIVDQLLDGKTNLGRRRAFKTMAMDKTKDRNQQFEIISLYKELYFDSLNPILSIDTKKRELLGNFYATAIPSQPRPFVFSITIIRDFADGYVIPHGLHDLKRNRGYIDLGGSYNTHAFACDSIFQWWTAEGNLAWPQANSLLLLCDGGGSNSSSQYLFKQNLPSPREPDRPGNPCRSCTHHIPPSTIRSSTVYLHT